MENLRIVTAGILLVVCTITDLRVGKVNALFCAVVFLVGIFLDALSVMTGGELHTVLIALIPGIVFLGLARITGAVGIGDGIVILTLGTVADIGEIICGLTVAMFLAAVTALILMIFAHRNGKSNIPFVPFLFAGMFCNLL